MYYCFSNLSLENKYFIFFIKEHCKMYFPNCLVFKKSDFFFFFSIQYVLLIISHSELLKICTYFLIGLLEYFFLSLK